MKAGDWGSLAVLAAFVGLFLLARRNGRHRAASAFSAAYASGQADLRAELAASAVASATGGSVAVNIGDRRELAVGELSPAALSRLVQAVLSAADNGPADNGLADHYLDPAVVSVELLRGHTPGGDDPYGRQSLSDSARRGTAPGVHDVRSVAVGSGVHRDAAALYAPQTDLT